MNIETKKNFCLVSSGGGHLSELLFIKKNSNIKKNFFYIVNKKIKFKSKNKIYYVSHGVRGPKLILNFIEILLIFIKEKPTTIVSTGASVAFPAFVVGKFFFNSRLIFFESITRFKHPSLTAKIVYFLSDEFYYPWKELRNFFPKGKVYNILKNL